MISTALRVVPPSRPAVQADHESILAGDSRYSVFIASTPSQVAAALRLRYEVFNQELCVASSSGDSMEFDEFDLRCKHLIATERSTGKAIGTYRVNTIVPNEGRDRFYSFDEFTLETLPESILRNAVETGRACVSAEHRGTKALFLLWKGLARYLAAEGKRYIFGCCSIFTRDERIGQRAYQDLVNFGHVSQTLFVTPRKPIEPTSIDDIDVSLPPLFEMYLKLGAKVCGPPTYDQQFGSVDFLVVLDLDALNERHRRMFFGAA